MVAFFLARATPRPQAGVVDGSAAAKWISPLAATSRTDPRPETGKESDTLLKLPEQEVHDDEWEQKAALEDHGTTVRPSVHVRVVNGGVRHCDNTRDNDNDSGCDRSEDGGGWGRRDGWQHPRVLNFRQLI